MPKLTIGTSDFKETRDEGGYFVDKSLLIRSVLDGNKCTLLPRPRRFGKTLNLSMLRYFFELSDEDRRPLFDGLAISRDADAMQHQGKYPVISLSLKNVKSGCWADARDQFVELIGNTFQEFGEAEDGLPKRQAAQFRRLCDGEGSTTDLVNSLANLISHVHAHYGQPVVVLIDEYDTPVTEARSKGYYDEMIDFMRSWLGGGLKHHESAATFRAVVTGCLRIAKESLFSGLNNLTTATMLKTGPFEDKFGFTQEEVDELVAAFDLPQRGKSIRDWYNGYRFGRTTIYNPWSVINCIAEYPNEPGPHWLNTASNSLIYEELDRGGLELKHDLEKLLGGHELRYPIEESIVYGEVGTTPQHIWSFLYNSGYLKAEDPEQDPTNPKKMTYRLSIPNLEVSFVYEKFVERIFDRSPGCGGVQPFLDCFTQAKPAEDLQRTLQPLVLSLVSHHDTARQPEAVFHAFVLGLLANLRAVYEIRSNAESGYGRADVTMRPTTGRYPIAYVIEFKSIKPDADVEAALNEGLEQIDEKEYTRQLREAGVGDEHLRRLAMVLRGKEIYVREAE